jgi:hypothetical protein
LTAVAERRTAVPEQPPAGPSAVSAGLHRIAQALREGPPLGPEAQRALAALIDELGNALPAAEPPTPEMEHLAGTTAEFVHALHRRETGRLAAARDRLEQAILGIEAQAPLTAGVARRVLDALANLGI